MTESKMRVNPSPAFTLFIEYAGYVETYGAIFKKKDKQCGERRLILMIFYFHNPSLLTEFCAAIIQCQRESGIVFISPFSSPR
jgi:hypothetical protein